MNISKRIKEIRERKGLKQSDIADILGIEQANYSRFERRDNKLTIEQLEQIAAALGVTIRDFLFDERSTDSERELEDLRREIEFLKRENEILREVMKLEGLKKEIEYLKQENRLLKKEVEPKEKKDNFGKPDIT